MKKRCLLLTALLLFLGVSGVYAGRKYVGFSSGGYSNTQLQNALTDAGEGDTVFVAAGLYLADAAEFTVKQKVTLIGGYDKSDTEAKTRRYPGQFVPFTNSDLSTTTQFTILDGNAYKRTRHTEKHRVVKVESGGVVDGCLIRNGHIRNGNGGGVLLNGGKLYNSIVRGNVAMNHPDSAEALGGGVFIQNGGELINCLVAYNMANDGYGVAAGVGGGKMINNTITANTYSPVFAKIKGGTFKMYAGSTAHYRDPWQNGEIPKNTQEITMTDFYISRILTTQGQYAVFCAAMDITESSSYGYFSIATLKTLTDPITGGTLEDRYKFNGLAGTQTILYSKTDANTGGLKYDGGVWHPIVDTVTVEYPVGNVNRYGALAYSVWLGGGLPTEAQWEFAARREPNGVSDNLYSGAYGTTSSIDIDTWQILDTIAWVANNRSIDTTPPHNLGIGGTSRPHEVARKRPNAMGIYDMTGNMAEICADWHHGGPTYSPTTNPIYNTVSTRIVARGGSYSHTNRSEFSLTYRTVDWEPTSLGNSLGFRPVVVF